MSTFEPGTVAVATVDGEVQRIFRTGENEWCDTAGFGRLDEEISDVRPLVVLDLDDFRWAAMVLRDPKIEGMGTRNAIADQIEAQTKPPRIPEPGLWGVVEARIDYTSAPPATRYKFVRTQPALWIAERGGQYEWDDLIDPTLVREGVES